MAIARFRFGVPTPTILIASNLPYDLRAYSMTRPRWIRVSRSRCKLCGFVFRLSFIRE